MATSLTVAFLVLSVVALLVAGSFQLYFSIRAQQESVAREQQFIAQDAAKTVVIFVQEKFVLLESVAELSDPRVISPEEQERHLRSLLGLEPAFRHLVFLDAQGREVVESSRLAQTTSGRLLDQAGADALVQVQQGGRYVGPVYVDDATSEPMVIVAVPIIDVFGDFQGTLMAEVNLKFIWDLVDQLEVGEGGLAYVVDRYGKLIAFGDVTRVLRGENVSQLNEVSEFIRSSAPVDETGANISTGINGTNVVATYVPLGTPDWAVVVELPVAEAYRGVIQSTVISASGVLIMAILAGLLGVLMARRLSVPMRTLTETAGRIAEGEMDLQVQAARVGPAEVVDLANAFNSMTAQLRELIGGLEERVAARTRDLARRTQYLEATTAVARDAASELDLQDLLSNVVTLISERFGFYHTGIFLLDPTGELAELRAASSEGGRRMLARGHRLRVGDEGIVGYVAGQGMYRVALDVGEDAVHFDNPDLPGTRSEIALPLRARGEIIGVLDVQSTEPGAFSGEDVTALQALADQVAVAISNARLFRQAEESVETERRAYGELSRQAWRALLREKMALGFRSSEQGVTPASDMWLPEMESALRMGEIVQGDDGDRLAIPIKIRDQVIGVIDGRKPDGAGTWAQEEIELLQVLTERLGLALEGARLYRDSQRREARERAIGQIAGRLRETLDMETVLKVAAQELCQSLGLPEVVIRMAPGKREER